LSEKQIPQAILNQQAWKEAGESWESSCELAKQVLFQLSYAPILATHLFQIIIVCGASIFTM
jgi:hypothetical protein